MTHPLYHLLGPTAWATPPSSYSYSSLTAIERCPRQWQLGHSRYSDLARFPTRPNPSTVEGEIVHAVLDRLFKALAVRGMPALGTLSFRESLAEVDVQMSVRELIVQHERRLAEHPRANAFRLRTGPQQLVNRVVRLFRSQYQDAVATHRASGLPAAVMRAPQQLPSGPALTALFRERGALSGLPLVHPTLPFGGILDLIWSDSGDPVIADFKTGQVQPQHKKQVAYYGVLWLRCSGTPPSRLEVRYPGCVETVRLAEGQLVEIEDELAHRIHSATELLREGPAVARLGDHCCNCDVRQFCDVYWSSLAEVPRRGATVSPLTDAELYVYGQPTNTGFEAKSRNGRTLSVVFPQELAPLHGPFVQGERLRVLGAHTREDSTAIELKPWTEVSHGAGTPSQ